MKVGYAAVFTDTTRRGTLPEEASIHTAEMTAMKEMKEREDIGWVIYTDSLSSMLAIENIRENCPILNQIYDILTELHNQEKQLTLCKVPAHIGFKGNEEADKAAKLVVTSYFGSFLYLGSCCPFCLYLVSPSIFVSIRILHFSSLVSFLKLLVSMEPVSDFLSIPLLVAHICYTPFLRI